MGNICGGTNKTKAKQERYDPTESDFGRLNNMSINLTNYKFHQKGKKMDNDYNIGKKIASGAFGTVRQCELKRTKDRRAVKIMVKKDLSAEHVKEF